MSTHLAAPLQGPVSLNVAFSPESAGQVRRTLVSWLAHHDASAGAIHDARLVATELVANSVRHASPLANGTILVRWSREDDRLAFSVSDGGGGDEPRLVIAGEDAEQGRGLAIVEALSLRWWVERTRKVHTVHVLVPLT